MEVLEAIEKRRSVRDYKPLSIPKEHLKKILEAARLAPSAGNRQPWRFIIVRKLEQKRLLAKIAQNQMFLEDAGAIIVVSHDRWFLDRICTHLLAFEDDGVEWYDGNWSEYAEYRRKKYGAAADRPHRYTHRKLTR